MTFKSNWEKSTEHFELPALLIEAMVKCAMPAKKLATHKLLSGGCANLNVKITVEGEQHPFILRVYLRDKEAAFREQKLAALIKKSIPIPEVYFIGEREGYQFSITQYMSGVSLRDLLLKEPPQHIKTLLTEAGLLLSRLQNYRFSTAGFFDANLHISHPLSLSAHISFAEGCLEHKSVIKQIGREQIAKISYYLHKNQNLLPTNAKNYLVHGDYDPANILVDKVNKQWHITAVLDWEFAFAGSPLWDVANMLRYAHHMPPVFKESFLLGLKEGGVHLPENWLVSIHLFNLISLLDILVRSSPSERPNQRQDIRELITYIIQQLDAV